MGSFSGRQFKGAVKALREMKRKEAEDRNKQTPDHKRSCWQQCDDDCEIGLFHCWYDHSRKACPVHGGIAWDDKVEDGKKN
jgi:hypothetical protein